MTGHGGWQPGDCVILTPTGQREDWTAGVVSRLVDLPVPGVQVALCRPIRGCADCTASPRELIGVEALLALRYRVSASGGP